MSETPRLSEIVHRLFDEKQRIRLALLIVMSSFGALLEAVGIGIVVPFVALLSSPEDADLPSGLQRLAIFFDSRDQLILSAGAVIVGVVILKNLYLAWLTDRQLRFVFDGQVRLSARLFEAYLSKPIQYYVDRNSSDLLRNVFEDVRITFSHLVQPSIVVVSELSVVAMLTLLVLLSSPVSAIASILLVGGIGVVFYLGVRKHATQQGQIQQREVAQVIKWAQQGFGAIREVLVYDSQKYFSAHYLEHLDAYSNAARKGQFVRQLPRFGVEVLGVTGIVLVLILLVLTNKSDSLLPLLSLFVLAAVRLMPTLTRLIASFTSIRHHFPSLGELLTDLSVVEEESEGPTIEWKGDLVLENVSFEYNGSTEKTLDGICLTIPQRATVAIVGPSGSGKSTLASLMLGLLSPTEGVIHCGGQPVSSSLRSWRSQFGFIPQPTYLLDGSVRENIAFGVPTTEIREELVWHVLELARLMEFVRGLPDGLETRVGEFGGRLSGGQRQRLGIARALYRQPQFLILDEATSALDPQTEAEITDALQTLRGKQTMIIVAHRIQTIHEADLIVFLKEGRIVGQGDFNKLCSEVAEFADYVKLSSLDRD